MLISCDTVNPSASAKQEPSGPIELIAEAENCTHGSNDFDVINTDSIHAYVKTYTNGWIAFEIDVPVAGSYKSEIQFFSESSEETNFWIEDYYDNKVARIIDLTGNIAGKQVDSSFSGIGKDGSPLNAGLHKMKLHFDRGVQIDRIKFSLQKKHQKSPAVLVQKTDGLIWEVVWADEFENNTIDSTKWSFDTGNWGWGNNENQYYTAGRTENARIENGNLIIEARKNDMGREWTSARLTTRGNISFLYGKIEFRAKLPAGKGNWSAGWTLGNEYIDELSRPFCGQIDIMESVGFEIDDDSGNGLAHATSNCGAYYFKSGHQPAGIVEVKDMYNQFHTYAVEWRPESIKVFVDDRQFIEYNESSTDLSWPFSKPQNIVLHLAMGGGWAGAYGIDENLISQKMTIDYIRVYELR